MTGFRRPVLFLLLLLMLLQGGAAAAPAAESPLGDLDFALSVVPIRYTTGLASKTLNRSILEAETVTIPAGSRINDLLRARSIEPDGDALSAVYLLNPDVRDVNQLKAGARLVIPSIPSGERPEDALVRLSLVPETKEELEQVTASIEKLVPRVSEPPAERKEVSEAISTISGYLEELTTLVEERELPLSPEMLVQSLASARLVREILDKSPEARWSAANRQAVIRISEDMALKARNFDEVRGPGKSPMRWRDVRVVVSVVQLPGQKPVSDLRVFYAPEALVEKSSAAQPFPGFSPQVAKRLIEADYVFWAASPGSSRPVTEQLKQKVRRTEGGEIKLQIAVRPPVKGSR